jgi:hypothetical protein
VHTRHSYKLTGEYAVAAESNEQITQLIQLAYNTAYQIDLIQAGLYISIHAKMSIGLTKLNIH